MNELTKDTFDKAIKNDTVIVNFGMPGCFFCDRASRIMENIAETNKVTNYKINTDKEMDLVNKYDIAEVPTLIVLKNGKLHKKIVKNITKKLLQEAII